MDSRTALVTLARFAQGQWGMVTSAQAVKADVSYMQVKRMTEAGLLEKAGQGVYLMIGGQAAAARHRAVKVAWLRMDPGVPAWSGRCSGRTARSSRTARRQCCCSSAISWSGTWSSLPRSG